ncbi:unnamed protein product, partial [Amoebophrya sp. A120]
TTPGAGKKDIVTVIAVPIDGTTGNLDVLNGGNLEGFDHDQDLQDTDIQELNLDSALQGTTGGPADDAGHQGEQHVEIDFSTPQALETNDLHHPSQDDLIDRVPESTAGSHDINDFPVPDVSAEDQHGENGNGTSGGKKRNEQQGYSAVPLRRYLLSRTEHHDQNGKEKQEKLIPPNGSALPKVKVVHQPRVVHHAGAFLQPFIPPLGGPHAPLLVPVDVKAVLEEMATSTTVDEPPGVLSGKSGNEAASASATSATEQVNPAAPPAGAAPEKNADLAKERDEPDVTSSGSPPSSVKTSVEPSDDDEQTTALTSTASPNPKEPPSYHRVVTASDDYRAFEADDRLENWIRQNSSAAAATRTSHDLVPIRQQENHTFLEHRARSSAPSSAEVARDGAPGMTAASSPTTSMTATTKPFLFNQRKRKGFLFSASEKENLHKDRGPDDAELADKEPVNDSKMDAVPATSETSSLPSIPYNSRSRWALARKFRKGELKGGEGTISPDDTVGGFPRGSTGGQPDTSTGSRSTSAPGRNPFFPVNQAEDHHAQQGNHSTAAQSAPLALQLAGILRKVLEKLQGQQGPQNLQGVRVAPGGPSVSAVAPTGQEDFGADENHDRDHAESGPDETAGDEPVEESTSTTHAAKSYVDAAKIHREIVQSTDLAALNDYSAWRMRLKGTLVGGGPKLSLLESLAAESFLFKQLSSQRDSVRNTRRNNSSGEKDRGELIQKANLSWQQRITTAVLRRPPENYTTPGGTLHQVEADDTDEATTTTTRTTEERYNKDFSGALAQNILQRFALRVPVKTCSEFQQNKDNLLELLQLGAAHSSRDQRVEASSSVTNFSNLLGRISLGKLSLEDLCSLVVTVHRMQKRLAGGGFSDIKTAKINTSRRNDGKNHQELSEPLKHTLSHYVFRRMFFSDNRRTRSSSAACSIKSRHDPLPLLRHHRLPSRLVSDLCIALDLERQFLAYCEQQMICSHASSGSNVLTTGRAQKMDDKSKHACLHRMLAVVNAIDQFPNRGKIKNQLLPQVAENLHRFIVQPPATCWSSSSPADLGSSGTPLSSTTRALEKLTELAVHC